MINDSWACVVLDKREQRDGGFVFSALVIGNTGMKTENKC